MKKMQAGLLKRLGWLVLLVSVFSAVAGPAQAVTQAKAPSAKAAKEVVNYDAIVVGTNYGAMITAAILAKNGLKILVVEELDQTGGSLGSSLYNGYWLDFGARGVKDYADPVIIITKKAQYGRKAAAAAGADIAWVGPMTPLVLMHRMADGKVVPITADAEGSAKFATEALDLNPEQATQFLSILKGLAKEDPAKWMDVTIEEWLSNIKDKALHTAFLRIAMLHMADPLNESSVGRWIVMLRNPQEVFKVDDSKIGNQQGMIEAYARVIRKHGGEIKLGLQTMEITTEGDKVVGIVTRDKISMVEEFRAPVVVYGDPIWEAFKVLDEKRFPPEVVANARKQEPGYRGDLMVLNIGVKRVPTIRATGKPDTYIGFNQFVEETTAWYIPTLSSKKAAPPGKHLISVQTGSANKEYFTFKEGKARLEHLKEYMRKYYSDLDEVIEWERYQWPKLWATSSYWKKTPQSPMEVPGLNGLYFTGSTVDVDGVFQDVAANSAMQVAQKILQRSGKARP